MVLEQTNSVEQYVFYVGKPQDAGHTNTSLGQQYSIEVWKPTLYRLVPKFLATVPVFVWSALHYLKLFRSPNYSIFAIYLGTELVHYSVVLPKYFRTPFMAENDLQIGPCWTHNEHRRKGIASYAIQTILETYEEPNRRFWYIVREENIPSRRLAEKAGLILYGKGIKKQRLSIRALGTFTMEEQSCPSPCNQPPQKAGSKEKGE